MKTRILNEPVVLAGAIVALVEAMIVMSVALGWLRLDESQLASIMGMVVALAAVVTPIVASVWARSKVYPTRQYRIVRGLADARRNAIIRLEGEEGEQ